MSYRDDLDALEARVESLRQEARAKLAELERARGLANDARRLVRARMLEAQVATPCTALWDDMKGDARVRHCGHCKKNVYNFSELTRDEIDALIVEHEGKLCSRFYLRADGTMLTKDCTRDILVRPSRLAVVVGAAAIAAGATVGMGGSLVDAHHDVAEIIEQQRGDDFTMGETVFEPPPEGDTASRDDEPPHHFDFTQWMPEGSR